MSKHNEVMRAIRDGDFDLADDLFDDEQHEEKENRRKGRSNRQDDAYEAYHAERSA